MYLVVHYEPWPLRHPPHEKTLSTAYSSFALYIKVDSHSNQSQKFTNHSASCSHVEVTPSGFAAIVPGEMRYQDRSTLSFLGAASETRRMNRR